MEMPICVFLQFVVQTDPVVCSVRVSKFAISHQIFFPQMPCPCLQYTAGSQLAAASTTPKVNQKTYVTCAVVSNRKTVRAFLLLLSGIGLAEIDLKLLKPATGILSQQLASVSSEAFHQGIISLECEVILVQDVQL